jgi:hypothetical protein
MNNPFQSFLPPHGDHTSTPSVRGDTSRRSNYQQDETHFLDGVSFPPARGRSGWTAGFSEDIERARSYITTSPQLDLQVVDLRLLFERDAAEALKLFDRCYALYRRSFTDPNEIAPETALIKALLRTSNPCHMLVLMQGSDVIGVRHSSILKTDCAELGTCAFDEYLYVDPSVRKGGIGKALLEKTDRILASWGIRFAFAEINDPNVMTPELVRKDLESGISPEQRLRFWKKCGYEGIDAPYLQPPLTQELDAVLHLRIAIKQIKGMMAASVPSKSFIALLRTFHSTFVPDVNYCESAGRLYEEIKRTRPVRTPIIPLDDPRSALGPWVPENKDNSQTRTFDA